MTRQVGRYPAQIIIQPEVADFRTIVSGLETALTNPSTIVIGRHDQLNQPVEVNISEMWEPNLTQASNSASNETKVGLTATAKVTLAYDKFKVFSRVFNGKVTTESAKSVTTITRSGTVATVTTPTPHNYTKGDFITIAGATQVDYNGTFVVATVTSTTTFTYAVANSPVTPATGTITVQSNDHGVMQLSDDAGLTFGTAELPFYTVVIRPYIGANVSTNPELYVIFPKAGMKANSQMQYSLGSQWGYSIDFTGYPDEATGLNRVLRGDTSLIPA
jgi:hypothetical protein